MNNSTNLTAEIIAWEENTTAMEFDGAHHFGVSARKITLRYSAGSETNLLVDTDLSSYTMEWANETGAGDGRPVATLTDARFSVEKSGTIIRIRALDTNCGMNGPLVSYLLLKANRWKILITVTQQGFDEVAGNRFVNVLSFNAGLGSLGSNIITSAAAEARGAGMAGILKNTANFGPSGTVPVAGINLIRADVSASTFNKLPASLFDMVDIVYLHYIENAYFGATDAQTVLNWLDTKPNRVLVVTYDAAAYTSAIKNALNLQVSYSTLSTGNFPLMKNTGNQYFTTSGPFTSAANGYSPIPDGFKFRQYDANYGALDPAAYPDVIPVLNTASLYNGSGILLGVDPARRIVYTGDIDLFGSGGTGAPALTTDSCISNTNGNVNSNGAKLMANLWAWMTEVVLGGSEPRL